MKNMKTVFILTVVMMTAFTFSAVASQFAWSKIPNSENAKMAAVGKIDSDTIDDLAGIWGSDLWIRYGATGAWVKAGKPSADLTGVPLKDPIGVAIGSALKDRSDSATTGIKNCVYVIYPEGIWTMLIK